MPWYQIKVLSTFSSGGIGLNPNPAKHNIYLKIDNTFWNVNFRCIKKYTSYMDNVLHVYNLEEDRNYFIFKK